MRDSEFSPPVPLRFVAFAPRYQPSAGDDETSQVPGGSSRTWPALSPRWSRCLQSSRSGVRPTFSGSGGAFRYLDCVGLHDERLTRLDHAARTLAVYASQPGSPPNHARLASGWRLALAGQDFNLLDPSVRFP